MFHLRPMQVGRFCSREVDACSQNSSALLWNETFTVEILKFAVLEIPFLVGCQLCGVLGRACRTTHRCVLHRWTPLWHFWVSRNFSGRERGDRGVQQMCVRPPQKERCWMTSGTLFLNAF